MTPHQQKGMKIYDDNYSQPHFATIERPRRQKMDNYELERIKLPQIALTSSNSKAQLANPQDPYEYKTEKLLYEHDPHLLEEKRYFARLKNFEIVKAHNYENQYSKVLIPKIQKQQRDEDFENMMNAQRRKTYEQ